MNPRRLQNVAFALVVGMIAAPCVQALDPGLAIDGESALRKLSEPQLKALYVGCSSAALQGLLGSSEIALCSIGYEILLREFFSGDFLALWTWSRSLPEAPHRN